MQHVERVSGVLTLVVGLGIVAGLAIGPLACASDGASCSGLLWDSLAWLTVGVPTVSVLAIGLGALQIGISGHLRSPLIRWGAVVALAVPTLLLLIVAPYGVVMFPVFGLALWTALVSQFQTGRASVLVA